MNLQQEKIRILESINKQLGSVNDTFLEMTEGFAGRLTIEEVDCDPELAEKIESTMFSLMDEKKIHDHLEIIKTDYLKGNMSDEEYDIQSAYLLGRLNKE